MQSQLQQLFDAQLAPEDSSNSSTNTRGHQLKKGTMFNFDPDKAMALLKQAQPERYRHCDDKVHNYLRNIAVKYFPLHLPLVLLLLFEGHNSFFTLEVAHKPAALLMSSIQDVCNHITKSPKVAAQLLSLMVHRPDLATAINKWAFQALLQAKTDTGLAVLAWAKECPEGVWEEGRPDPAHWLSNQIKQQCRAA